MNPTDGQRMRHVAGRESDVSIESQIVDEQPPTSYQPAIK